MEQTASTVPVLHANRLFLVWGLLSIRPYLPKHLILIDSRLQLLKEMKLLHGLNHASSEVNKYDYIERDYK
jgi:hypothetical protein